MGILYRINFGNTSTIIKPKQAKLLDMDNPGGMLET